MVILDILAASAGLLTSAGVAYSIFRLRDTRRANHALQQKMRAIRAEKLNRLIQELGANDPQKSAEVMAVIMKQLVELPESERRPVMDVLTSSAIARNAFMAKMLRESALRESAHVATR
jgi:hypothetical protein